MPAVSTSLQASSSRQYATLWLPRFHLQAQLRHPGVPSFKTALAVLDSDHTRPPDSCTPAEQQGRVLHATPKAEASGVLPGLSASQALARCAMLRLLTRDSNAEKAAQELLLTCATNWTPDFESIRPGLCVLDLSRHPQARRHPEKTATALRQFLASHQLDARIGMASKADLATLAAHATDSFLVLQTDGASSHHQLLQHLPISLLQPSREITEVLHLWGIHTLAQLIALPRPALTARLGSEGAALWDMAQGGQPRLLQLVRPVIHYSRHHELDHPVESLEPLLFLLRRLLGKLCSSLADAWLLAAAQRVQLHFDDRTQHDKTLHVAEATRDADLLLRLLHTHLESVAASSPIIAITLSLSPTRASAQQTALFERSLRDPNRLAETLSQLEALLGPGNVGKVQMLPSRHPDAFAVINYLEPTTASASAPPTSTSEELAYGLPLKRYRPPQQVGVSLHEGRPQTVEINRALLHVTSANGPWLMSGDWWDPHRGWERMIWEIATHDGALYQLAQEKQRWVLDGVWG